MEMKEKLAELLSQVQYQGNAVHGYHDNYILNSELADHLIANGVTFATDNNVGSKWIPVTERLPDVARRVLVTDGENISFGYVLNYECKDWNPWSTQYPVIYDKVTHWMPLPEPPKGEAQQDCTYNKNGHCIGQKMMPECDAKNCDRRKH